MNLILTRSSEDDCFGLISTSLFIGSIAVYFDHTSEVILTGYSNLCSM